MLDTSVLVAAIRSPAGASKALLDAILNGHVELLISTALVLEYEAVTTREEHLSVSGYTRDEVRQLLDSICELGNRVRVRWVWRPQLPDPDDEMVLETAINGYADAIVTFNRSDFIAAAGQFGISVLNPKEALEETTSQ